MIDSQERVVKIASYYRELYGFGSGILSSVLNLDPWPDPSRPKLRFSKKKCQFFLTISLMRTLHILNDYFLLTNILSLAFFRSHFVFCIAISWIHFVYFGLVISFLVWICTKNNLMAKIAISSWYQFILFKTFFLQTFSFEYCP